MKNLTESAMDSVGLLFGWCDFSVFGLMLVTLAAVGVYYGFFNKQETKIEYLHGGKNMRTFPVAMSLVACHISGVTVMGVPSEIYTFGSLYSLVCVSCILVAITANYVYLPVFFDLQLTSTYEYLERRFSRSVRLMASVLYTISVMLYIPIVVYVPALAFSQVSGVSLHAITPIVCVICIFYTMLGGFKAVVWTDVIQIVIMVGSSAAVMFIGVYNVGGISTVFERAYKGGRTNIFETNPSPLLRASLWSVIIGTGYTRAANMLSQSTVQKFLAIPKKSSIKTMLFFYCLGIILFKVLSISTGLIIYAAYYKCDPVRSKAVSRADQLLPYFVMDIAGNIPGFPGLFIAGVFSASISSMASGLNCLSATVFEDLISPFLKGNENETRVNMLMKSIVLAAGTLCLFLVVIVEKLGGVLEVSYSVQGVTCGALLGLFSLGILFPWANAKGALWGSICSLVVLSFIVFGAQNAIATGTLVHETLPTSIEECPYNVTFINSTIPAIAKDEPFVLFRISYWYYGVIGSFTVIFVGMLVSAATGLENPYTMDDTLVAPFVRTIIRNRKKDLEEVMELAATDTLINDLKEGEERNNRVKQEEVK